MFKTRPLAILSAATLLITGITGAWRPAHAATVTLRWGIYADPSRLQVAQAQVAAFEKQHPDISVKIEAVPFGTYYQKLATQLAAGTADDVFMISGAYFPKISPQGGLMDLTGMIASNHIDLTKYTTEQDDSVYNGHVYALPYELDIQALYYNKAYFDAAKVTYPTKSWTWSNLLNAAQKLTRKVNGHQVWGFYSDDLYPSWVSFIGQAGGSIFGQDQRTPTLNTPQVKKALTFMTDLIYRYHVSPAPQDIPTGTNPFQAGLVAMALDGSYSILPTLQSVKFPWDIAPLPADAKRAVAYWTQGLAISTKTHYSTQAWQFAQFLASPAGEAIMASTKFSTPSLKSVAQSPAYLKGSPSHMVTFIDEFANAVPVPFNSNWLQEMSGPNSALGAPFAQLWLHKISVDQAVSQATSNINNISSQ